jgi:NDP-sugar pyrophosphorylase family protein
MADERSVEVRRDLDSVFPAIVLCGGLGTRLRGVVSDRPKSLASVAGRPFLAHVLDELAAAGIRHIVLSAGHMADQVVAFANTDVPEGMDVSVAVEPKPLGTGGAIRFAAELAGLTGDFLAMNGDTFFDGSLRVLMNEHVRHGARASLAAVMVDDATQYGAVRFHPDTWNVDRFEEKGTSGPNWINAGVYVLSRSVLGEVPVDTFTSLEREVLPRLAGQGLIAVPYPEATLLDIGTPAGYAAAAMRLTPRTES